MTNEQQQSSTQVKTDHNIMWMNLTNGYTILAEYVGKHEEYPGVSFVRNPIVIDESSDDGVGFSEYMGGKASNVLPINNASIITTIIANGDYKDLYFEILADIAKQMQAKEEQDKHTGQDIMNEIPEPDSEQVVEQKANQEDDVYKNYDPSKAMEQSIVVYFTNPDSKTDENYLDILNRVTLPKGSKPS